MIKLDLPFPTNCENCPFAFEKKYVSTEWSIRTCSITKENCDLYYYKRHPKCPLKKED